MATALHIYTNLLWRAGSLEARIKKGAALRLLTEPHYRLPLDELAKALASSLGSGVPSGFLTSTKLAEILSSEDCFSHSDVTGNVLVDAASLLGAGKACLKELIDKAWDTSSPSSWACNQLAWYIVSRQQMDMHAADLFMAQADDAESFLAGAWSSRMVLRDVPYESPYESLEELLKGQNTLDLVHKANGERAVKLAFSALLHALPNNSGGGGNSSNNNTGISSHNDSKSSGQPDTVEDTAKPPGKAPVSTSVGAPSATGGAGAAGVRDVAGLSASLEQTHLTPRQAPQPHPSSLNSAQKGSAAPEGLSPGGGGGRGHGGRGDVEMVDVDDMSYGTADGEEGELVDDDDDDGGGDDGGAHAQPPAAAATYPSSRGGGASPSASASGAAPSAADGQQRSHWPLRPELLSLYVRAVFGGPGPSDQLMAFVAMVLVEAGGCGSGGGYRSGTAGAQQVGPEPFDPYRFCMPLSHLAAVVRERAPYLLPTAASGAAERGAAVGILMQRLRERSSRGCFRVLMQVGEGEAEWSVEGEAGGGGGRRSADGCNSEVLLDLDALQDRVVDALTTASYTVYSGIRPVDLIRRATAAHLATRTLSFARRAHCIRLTTLSNHLAEVLPLSVFDPNRLSGLARIVSAETTNNVMHVFRRPLTAGSPESAACVTLNVGKLLTEAGIRKLDSVTALLGTAVAVSGMVGMAQRGSSGAEAEAAAAAATAAVAATWARRHGWLATAQNALSDGYPPQQPQAQTAPVSGSPYAPPAAQSAATAGVAAQQHPSQHGNGGLPAPPSEAALAEAIVALFPPSPSGADVHPEKEAAVAAKRVAALSLAKALHTQPGGLLPLSSLSDIVQRQVPSSTALEHLLMLEPELFEMQEHWPGGPRGFRLKASGVMARAAKLPPVPPPAATVGRFFPLPPTLDSGTGLPLRQGVANCPYYMKNGTCGYGAMCKYNHPPAYAQPQQQPKYSQYQHQQQQLQYHDITNQASQRPTPTASALHHTMASAPGQPPRVAAATAAAASSPGGSAAAVPVAVPIAVPVSAAAVSLVAAASGPGGSSAQSPVTLEVKMVTTVCTPGHLDMLQHCFAATQVAIACKTAPHQQHPPAGGAGVAGSEATTTCLVQLFAPAVPATTNAGGGATGSAAQETGTGGAGAAGGDDGGPAAAAATLPPRWPATVYLVDVVGAGDKGEMLLGSLNALLEDPLVSKVVYWGAEVLPNLIRGCRVESIAPLYDISVLHAVVAAAAASAGARFESLPPLPSLATLLQQQGLMTPAGAAAMGVAPSCSRLWSARPLSEELKQQSVLEVVHLAGLWAGLLGRLVALPQQLSQAMADRLVKEQVAAPSQATATVAAVAAGQPVAVPFAVTASAAWPSTSHAAVGNTAAPMPPQPRGLLSVQRRGPGV